MNVIRYIVHRQLSTRSFHVDVDLVVQLTDFTRARVVVDDQFVAEQDEQVCVGWAAPEVLRHHRYSTKSDVWALAVAFWEVLSEYAGRLSCQPAPPTLRAVVDAGNCYRCWSHW